MIKNKTWDKLDRTETLQKEHGHIEKAVFRILPDTSFVYEKFGLRSFYGTIARIGIMDEAAEMPKDGKEVETESPNRIEKILFKNVVQKVA